MASNADVAFVDLQLDSKLYYSIFGLYPVISPCDVSISNQISDVKLSRTSSQSTLIDSTSSQALSPSFKCAVCGDDGAKTHYGVLSCLGKQQLPGSRNWFLLLLRLVLSLTLQ